MKASIKQKLTQLAERYQSIGTQLSDPNIVNDQARFRDLSKEYSQLESVVQCFQDYQQAMQQKAESEILAKDDDASLRELATIELETLNEKIKTIEQTLQILLLPKDPDDSKNIFLEIRAGTGGDEAALFVGDLFRMYSRYAEIQGWQIEIINASESEPGGFKEIIVRIIGKEVYGKLKFESGAHRVQRVPVTESQGRIHTSACTVAIMPEAEEVDHIDINPDDVKMDTFRASGAGGQHVNRTDSAVRLTHIPTGVVVECQDERSQHKNRAKAMGVLKAKLLDMERSKQQKEQAETRRNLVGSGDRSERIRTYNFPQGRVTDHRINLTLYQLPAIMEGQLDQVIEPLRQEHQADLLASIGE